MKVFSEETVAKLLELLLHKRKELLDALAKMLAARAEKPYERPPDSHERGPCPVIARKNPPYCTDSGDGISVQCRQQVT